MSNEETKKRGKNWTEEETKRMLQVALDIQVK